MDTEPTTLQEAILHFSDPAVCFETMVAVRWPDGVRCPHCGRDDVRFLSNQQKWECRARHPRKQFSIKAGTVFEDSPIKMDKWLTAVWLIVNAKNGISSLELHRAIGVTQKSAWFMLQRIRLAMQTGTFEKMSGEAHIDFLVDNKDVATVGRNISERVDLVLRGSYKGLGSVQGDMDSVNAHGDRPYFTIWDRVSRSPVRCFFSNDAQWKNRVRDLLYKRVLASGEVHYFRTGVPRYVLVRQLHDKTPDPTLPVAHFGCLPNLTGDLSTEEYLQRLREGRLGTT